MLSLLPPMVAYHKNKKKTSKNLPGKLWPRALHRILNATGMISLAWPGGGRKGAARVSGPILLVSTVGDGFYFQTGVFGQAGDLNGGAGRGDRSLEEFRVGFVDRLEVLQIRQKKRGLYQIAPDAARSRIFPRRLLFAGQ
jgi:hypothetical protein